MTRTTPDALAGIAASLAVLASCAPAQEPAADRAAAGHLSMPGEAAEQVGDLTVTREAYDENADGFVSRAEAEGYHQRYFTMLDDNGDGRRSRAELKPETAGTPESELYSEELVGATEREYIDTNMNRYNLLAEPVDGMMSTRDFDELLRDPDPASPIPEPDAAPRP